MLCKLILKARQKDEASMLEIIKRFLPIMKKYSHQLHMETEDAEQNFILYLLELIPKLPDNILAENNDGRIVNYIARSVKNFYNYSVNQKKTVPTFIHMSELSEKQKKLLNAKSATKDSHEDLLLNILEQTLNKNEFDIIYLHYFNGYSIAEIAESKHKSRQAINQMNLRALKKLADLSFL